MNLKIYFFLSVLLLGACSKKRSKIPKIKLISNSKQFMVQNGQDSTYIIFFFEDGDGNIGSDFDNNISIKDSRTDSIIAQYRIPNYTNSSTNYKSGEISLVLHSQCCVYPNGNSCGTNTNFPSQSMHYIIQIVDQAGNYSNEIKTPTITIDCL